MIQEAITVVKFTPKVPDIHQDFSYEFAYNRRLKKHVSDAPQFLNIGQGAVIYYKEGGSIDYVLNVKDFMQLGEHAIEVDARKKEWEDKYTLNSFLKA